MVATAESDPLQELGLRFDAQRAATELYCRAAHARRAEAAGAATPVRQAATVTTMRSL